MATSLDPFVDRLILVRTGFREIRPQVEAGEPWPLASHFGVEPEASWGPKEVLAHLAEMYPYWYRQVVSIVAAPSGPVPFGRTQEDPDRIAAIESDRRREAGVLFDVVDASIEPYVRLLGELSEAEAQRVGLHPARGEMTIPAILERMVAGHGEDHLRQLRDSVART